MPQKAADARAAEAGVVGDERDPGDRDRDDEVDALEHRRAALAAAVPQVAEAGAVERPPRQVEERGEHGPDRELAHELAHEVDRPEQRQRERDAAEDERPEPLGAEAEQLVRERGDGRGDDQQLEDRPADALGGVEDGRRPTSRAARAARASAPSPARARRRRSARRARASCCRSGCRAGSRGTPPAARAPARGRCPATSTSSETPRFPQRRPVSSSPSTRRRSGTGLIPQAGVPSIAAAPPFAGITRIRSYGCVLSLVEAPRWRHSNENGTPLGAPLSSPPPVLRVTPVAAARAEYPRIGANVNCKQ